MNIKILGWYNHGNVGDEAYKSAFPLLFSGHDLEFVEELNEGDAPDVVVLGGGDVVYPSFTQHFKKLPPTVEKIAASVSLTDNSDLPFLKNFKQVFVRDYRSALLADRSGYKSTYLPDFTFMLQPEPIAGRYYLQQKFAEQGHELYEKIVVCVVSNYLANTKLDVLARDLTAFLKLSQDMAQVCDETSASFVFMPFSIKSPWDDRVSCSWVADRCKFFQKNIVLWEPLDVQMTLDIIGAANACVSSRLHSSIFSTISGVPFIDLTHHTKNLGFLEAIEKTAWSMPFWEFSITHYKTLLGKFLSQTSPDASLQKFTQLARDRLRNAIIL